MKRITLLTTIVLALSPLAYADDGKVPYPNNYRNWTHVKSMLIKPDHPLATPFQGIHHVYGNTQAISGLKNGKYSDGSVLVFDLLGYNDTEETIQEGKRKLVGVMHKDAKRYSSTGGWGFEGFAANSKTERLTQDGGVSCFGCHLPQESTGYVFSQFRN